MEFSGKTALITGAAVGIGRAAAIRFAQAGAAVVLADIDEEKLNAAKEEIAAITPDVLAVVCDVSREEDVNKTVNSAIARFGGIDVLVNNAAIWRISSPFVETSTDIWKKLFDINLMGTVYFTRAVLPQMIDRRFGRVINVASVAGVYGNKNMSAYSATKGAMISMTKAIAKEVAEYGITVNSVSPGSVSESSDPDINATMPTTLSYMGRCGTDNENAGLICYLASEEAAYISGQNIQIDGCRKLL